MKEKSLEETVQNFIDYHGKKSFHIIGGWILYPGTPHEKKVPMHIEKGPIKWSKCKLCNEPLEPIQKNEPKLRRRKYCSHECRIEHDEIKKIKKKLGAEWVLWPPQKPPIPKNQLTYTLPGHNGSQFKYRGRSPRKNKKLD